MIDELHVQNVALIRDASIQPSAGLTVLTGETGTGKSALLSSIKLLMGERADATAVREGADSLVVEGRFFGAGCDPEGTVVRRRVESSGRGRVEMDGHMSSVREVAEGPGSTIDLCGQHEHQRLLQVSSHVELLDNWAGDEVGDALRSYREALRRANEAARELERVREVSRVADERVEEETFVLRRIDEVSPREGELEELEGTLPKAEHAEMLMRTGLAAHEGLSGDEGVSDSLSSIISELRGVSSYDERLGQFASALESSLIDIEDVASELRRCADSMEFDPERLSEMQERMGALNGLLRSYGPRMQDVFDRRASAAELVAAAQDGDALVRKASAAADEAERTLRAAADALDSARGAVAPRLALAITEQMAFLEMGSAEIEVALERLDRSQ